MTLEANKKDGKIFATIQQEYKILAEYKMIESEKLSGIYVIPSYSNSLLWFGVIFGRHGVYANCAFRFSIVLPDKFPDDKNLPAIIFQNDVMHPLVCPFTHGLNVKIAFPEWRTGEDHIWQILKYMQVIFCDPNQCLQNLTGQLNKEAAELLLHNKEEYYTRVKALITESFEHLFDVPPTDDPHYIVFEKFQEEIHGSILRDIISEEKATNNCTSPPQSTGSTAGLSWVNRGDFKPLSIE